MLKLVLVLLVSIAPVFSAEESYSSKVRKSIFGAQKTKEELYQEKRAAVLLPALQHEKSAQLEREKQLRQQEQIEQGRKLALQAQLEQTVKQEQLQILEDAVRLILSPSGLSEIGVGKIKDLSEDDRDIIIQTARVYKTGLFEQRHLLDLIDNIQRISANRENVITNLLDLSKQMPSLSPENRIALIKAIIWNGSDSERIIDVTRQALKLSKAEVQFRYLLVIIKDIITKQDRGNIIGSLVKLIDRCPDLLLNKSRNCVELYKSIAPILSADRSDVISHVLRLAMPDMLTGDLISLISKIQGTPKELRDDLVTRTEDRVIPIIVQQ